jgi:serine/threonine protein kinase
MSERRSDDIQIEINEDVVKKSSVSPAGYERLQYEWPILDRLRESPHVPKLYHATTRDESVDMFMERIEGEDAKQWLDWEEDWTTRKRPWSEVKLRLGQYVTAEMDLLDRGALYRDMSLEHIIFTRNKAVLVDFESTVFSHAPGRWFFNSKRGTWETMAPEEFPGHGELTARTATYRAAVLAHLALCGRLPFPRFPLRSRTHAWRKWNAAQVGQELPKRVRHVFESALEREPARRHRTPDRFLAAVQRAYEGGGNYQVEPR